MKLVPHRIPGAPNPLYLPDDLPLRVLLLPPTLKTQRPGFAFTGGSASRWVQHDTGNTAPTANEIMHYNWLLRGAVGRRPDGTIGPTQTSFHNVVGDNEVIVMIPWNEVAWHGGDGAGPCNYDGIATELTVNAGQNEARARRNAEWLAAGGTLALGIDADPIQHNACSGKDCPHDMRADGYWPTYIANVRADRKLIQAHISGEPVVPGTPAYAKPGHYPPKDEDWAVGAVMFWYLPREYEVTVEAPRLQYGFMGAKPVGPPIAKGQKFTGKWVAQGAVNTNNGTSMTEYVVTSYGTRVPMSHLTPKIQVGR